MDLEEGDRSVHLSADAPLGSVLHWKACQTLSPRRGKRDRPEETPISITLPLGSGMQSRQLPAASATLLPERRYCKADLICLSLLRVSA